MAASVLFIAVLDFSVFCDLNVIIRVKREKIKTPLDQCHGNCLSSSVMDSNSWGRSGSKNTNMWSHARQGQENEEASSFEQVKDKKIVGMQTSIPFYTKKDFAKLPEIILAYLDTKGWEHWQIRCRSLVWISNVFLHRSRQP